MNIYQRKAKAIGVSIEPSRRKQKKYDVYKDGVYQASIGAAGMMDYEKYLRQEGKEVADARRRAYKARHVHRHKKFQDNGRLSAAYLASRILW